MDRRIAFFLVIILVVVVGGTLLLIGVLRGDDSDDPNGVDGAGLTSTR